ncbi:hypothetical protein CC86DRAFT_379664 [Ophiobolus disseminans]|uniref:Uncharacterized protein n=1 Tax=Ophiobolus disseminans TaxID=1469910 RepID=A0A6A7AAB6_9PLEO|nr:hypothetical protein CC86DRAFT_379664 [Ophiobolus disseminans]
MYQPYKGKTQPPVAITSKDVGRPDSPTLGYHPGVVLVTQKDILSRSERKLAERNSRSEEAESEAYLNHRSADAFHADAFHADAFHANNAVSKAIENRRMPHTSDKYELWLPSSSSLQVGVVPENLRMLKNSDKHELWLPTSSQAEIAPKESIAASWRRPSWTPGDDAPYMRHTTHKNPPRELRCQSSFVEIIKPLRAFDYSSYMAHGVRPPIPSSTTNLGPLTRPELKAAKVKKSRSSLVVSSKAWGGGAFR